MLLIDSLRRPLLSRGILYVDETPIQVLKEEGRKPQSAVLLNGRNAGKVPIILLDYQPSESGKHAAAYLKDFKGYAHSDGYSQKKIIRCRCWRTSGESLWKPSLREKRRTVNAQPQRDDLWDLSAEDRYKQR